MQTIYVSNKGEDKNDGLTSESPVRSWKRLQVVCKGNQAMFRMEGKATRMNSMRGCCTTASASTPSPAKRPSDDISPNGDD